MEVLHDRSPHQHKDVLKMRQVLTLEASMPLEVRPPLSAPEMAPDARMSAIFLRPKDVFMNVLGDTLTYFLSVTCTE